MTYVRRPSEIKVFRYEGQARSEWPEWVQDYSVYTPIGSQPVSIDAVRTLIVPQAEGAAHQGRIGSFIVLEHDTLSAYTARDFGTLFEEVAGGE